MFSAELMNRFSISIIEGAKGGPLDISRAVISGYIFIKTFNIKR